MMSTCPPAYAHALALEEQLGDPSEDSNLLSFRRSMDDDEREAFPDAAVTRLHRLGLHRIFVPRALGGEFDTSEGFMASSRVLARRDMTVAVTYCTMLWSVLAWIGGSAEQKRMVAGWILDRGHFPCLAYSEERHGADLVSNSLRGSRDAGGPIRVTGEKWPINRATRSEFLVLLVRTDAGVHMRNHSLFIVDKARLDPSRYGHLPRVSTLGLRGCDISGIQFDRCALPEDSMVGPPGHGLELALKGFQVTRTFCASLSLGACDSALRIVAEFACERRLYGQRAFDLPHARDALGNSYLSQLVAECTSLVAARGLHLHTGQFAVWSSVVKVQVTRLCDHAMAQLAQVFGARHFLRQGPAHGIFQKILRDSAIVSIFDGSNIVCLNGLAAFLPVLARGTETAMPDEDVRRLFDLEAPLPALDVGRLELSSRGRDAVMQSLPSLLARLGRLRVEPASPPAAVECLDGVERAAQSIASAWDALRLEIAQVFASPGGRHGAMAFALAERYSELHSAVSCLGVWLHNRSRLGGFFAQSGWIGAALRRQGEPHFKVADLAPSEAASLCAQMRDQLSRNLMFSILQWPLAAPGSREEGARTAQPSDLEDHRHEPFKHP